MKCSDEFRATLSATVDITSQMIKPSFLWGDYVSVDFIFTKNAIGSREKSLHSLSMESNHLHWFQVPAGLVWNEHIRDVEVPAEQVKT